MTQAVSGLGPSRRHWLLRYLRLQQASDRRVQQALHNAMTDAEAALRALDGKAGVSAGVRRAQLLGTRGIVATTLKELYKELGDIIRSDQGEAAALASRLLYEEEAKIWAVIEKDKRKREQIASSAEAKARRNVQAMIRRIMKSEQPLSTRVYRAESLSKNQVSRVVSSHLARGSSAADMAKDVISLINPSVRGGVSYAATRLARTEINNAFHSQTLADVEDRPWIDEVQWNLSKSHPPRQPPCLCDRYASRGRFPANDVPLKPHPNCLCYTTPVLPDLDDVFARFQRGEYGSYLAEM